MRYIGSKARVLGFIENCVQSTVQHEKGLIFADLFAGTTVVAQHFKRLGYRILSNDYMAFSYALQVALIENDLTPSFGKLKIGTYEEVLDYINSLEPVQGFFYKNYCKSESRNGDFERNYFSPTNAGKIDAILHKLKYWKQNDMLSQIEESVLRASLIESVTKVSNISGTYGCFLKHDDPRKFMEVRLEPLTFIQSQEENRAFNEDALTLIDKISGDILYLDPPYNQRQYPPYYHILETISLDDEPKIYGKTGRRPYRDMLSPFCIKGKVQDALYSIVRRARFDHIFLSYNTEGLMSVSDIQGILSEFGEPEVYFCGHRRYKSNSNGMGHSRVKEVLFYVSKRAREQRGEAIERKRWSYSLFG